MRVALPAVLCCVGEFDAYDAGPVSEFLEQVPHSFRNFNGTI
jgi:hypothetical protein